MQIDLSDEEKEAPQPSDYTPAPAPLAPPEAITTPKLPDVYSIVAEGLTKRFGKKTAVESVTLRVREGEFFGFLGPNGAGKSTTIRMLCGLLRPDAGRIQVAGIDLNAVPLEVMRQIGVLPEETNLYERLTGEEFLMFAGQMYGLSRDETRSRTNSLLASGDGTVAALNGGYHAAFLVGAVFAASAAVVGVTLLRATSVPARDDVDPAV